MSGFVLKIIAMVSMTIDHIGYGMLPQIEVLRLIGRCAFIIYAFLMAESYYHLKNNNNKIYHHIIKLFILTLVSELPYDIYVRRSISDWRSQSVMPTLLLGFLALYLADMARKYIDNIFIQIVIYFAMAYLSYLVAGNYKLAGVLLIVMFYYYLTYADKLHIVYRLAILVGVILVYWFILMWATSEFGSGDVYWETFNRYKSWMAPNILTVVLLALYNRKQGYRGRIFDILYSVFYPLQFVVLSLVGAVVDV